MKRLEINFKDAAARVLELCGDTTYPISETIMIASIVDQVLLYDPKVGKLSSFHLWADNIKRVEKVLSDFFHMEIILLMSVPDMLAIASSCNQ
jgi:hypothetical protein